jgi:type II secretory ATPase GspE/PulE/Tfp pilus assembly ATPase PilB-like protein
VRRVCAQCGGSRCEACLQTGYHGRVPVLEWLRLDATQRDQMRTRGPAAVPPKCSIRDAARELVKSGVTSADEFERVFSR